jgi:hypothetical protein
MRRDTRVHSPVVQMGPSELRQESFEARREIWNIQKAIHNSVVGRRQTKHEVSERRRIQSNLITRDLGGLLNRRSKSSTRMCPFHAHNTLPLTKDNSNDTRSSLKSDYAVSFHWEYRRDGMVAIPHPPSRQIEAPAMCRRGVRE